MKMMGMGKRLELASWSLLVNDDFLGYRELLPTSCDHDPAKVRIVAIPQMRKLRLSEVLTLDSRASE